MKTKIESINTKSIGVFAFLLFSANLSIFSQEVVYPYFYRVYFSDKGDNSISGYSASDLLSIRAIARRQKAGISVPDLRDLPVNKSYLDKISLLGLKLHTTSRWMNTALFKSQNPFDLNVLRSLPFISNVKTVKRPGAKGGNGNKLDFQVSQTDFPSYDLPLTMLNGSSMHTAGYDGLNVLIAILDGGFLNSDVISSLAELRNRKGIRVTYDFVKKNKSVYNASTHGTAVLSVLAGSIPGTIEGTAPGADYLLLKTEDVDSEFPCEEDYWAAGAEYADSAGADIISSSLGYFNFDDPAFNYKLSDLDGNTAFITRVADIAASKGILVLNSAGNERNTSWKRIIFPADGDSVEAVGAVDGNKLISDFSSAGPSADRRIKPDNVTMGVSVTVQTSNNITGKASGTSFSCPVLSGFAACLLQAVPQAANNDIITVLHKSADRYTSPDSLNGYGIPNILIALDELQKKYIKTPEDGILVYPNPTSGTFKLVFYSSPGNLAIEIISTTGKIIYRKSYDNYPGRTIDIAALQHREEGVYLLRITDPSGIRVRKVIKINN